MTAPFDWASCPEPEQLLRFFGPRATERKQRLFAAACCRHVLPLIPHESDCRQLVEGLERHADEGVTPEPLTRLMLRLMFQQGLPGASRTEQRARSAVRIALELIGRRDDPDDPSTGEIDVRLREVILLTGRTARDALASRAEAAALSVGLPFSTASGAYTDEWLAQRRRQCDWLCDLFGHVVREVAVSPSMLAWNDGTVFRLAQTIYQEQRLDDLPILADALEEAGCTNADVLTHCRSGTEHIRGCWVVDLLLGKS